MFNANKIYKGFKAFTFQGRQFLALENGEGWEIYEGQKLEPRYAWPTIEHFKQYGRTGKLPEFFVDRERKEK